MKTFDPPIDIFIEFNPLSQSKAEFEYRISVCWEESS